MLGQKCNYLKDITFLEIVIIIRITNFTTGIMEKLKLLQEGANVDELLENDIIEKTAEKVEHEIESIFRENTDNNVNEQKDSNEQLKMCDNNNDDAITSNISENITQSDDDLASENITSKNTASENSTSENSTSENSTSENSTSENNTIENIISENTTSSDSKSETNHDNTEEIPPTIPLRKSKRKFLDVSTQTEFLGLTGCICCCSCGRSTPDDNIA